MKAIGSVFACLLLLAGTDALAQTAQTAVNTDAAYAVTAADAHLEATPAATASETPAGAWYVEQLRASAGPELLVGAAPYRLGSIVEQGAARELEVLTVQQNRRGGVTFLVVGASLIAAGLLIDGDAGAIVSVGGALVGAYGVYLIVR